MEAASHRRLSVDDLCTKHGNEDGHARHVAAVAGQLFDATRRWVGAPVGDRPLLVAAGRLHDLGYRGNPWRHARVSCEIIRREGIKGFTDSQRDDIAAAVALHPAGLGSAEAGSLMREAADGRRALRLAAYLRIADGLDHGHLQDAVIVGVRRTGRSIRVRVRCGHQPQGVEAARRKSDLWRSAFAWGIQFAPAAGTALHSGSLRLAELPPGEAARRLLWCHYGVLRAKVGGALAAESSGALHDLRGAIRSMRTVLRVFRRPLVPTSAGRIDHDLQRLNAALGAARDLDVWNDYLARQAGKARWDRLPRWVKFVDHQRELRRLQQTTVRRHLSGVSFRALQNRIGRLLRIELPRLPGDGSAVLGEGWGRRMLAKYLRRALKRSKLRSSHLPAKVHQLRLALRRVRHIGEFAEGRPTAPEGKLMRRVQAVERMLGRIRDVDLELARVRREGPAPPRVLLERLKRRRRRSRAGLSRAWRELEKPRFLRALRRAPRR